MSGAFRVISFPLTCMIGSMIQSVAVSLVPSYLINVVSITTVSTTPIIGIVIAIVRIVVRLVGTTSTPVAAITVETFVVSTTKAFPVSLLVSVFASVGMLITTCSVFIVASSFWIVSTSFAGMLSAVFNSVSVALVSSYLVDVIAVPIASVRILRLNRRTTNQSYCEEKNKSKPNANSRSQRTCAHNHTSTFNSPLATNVPLCAQRKSGLDMCFSALDVEGCLTISCVREPNRFCIVVV